MGLIKTLLSLPVSRSVVTLSYRALNLSVCRGGTHASVSACAQVSLGWSSTRHISLFFEVEPFSGTWGLLIRLSWLSRNLLGSVYLPAYYWDSKHAP